MCGGRRPTRRTPAWHTHRTKLLAGIRRFAVVIVGESRSLRLRRGRMIFKLFEEQVDCFLELWVVSCAPRSRVHFDFDVWRDTVILDFPLAFRCVETEVRRGDRAAIQQLRRSTDADQAAPRALADERTDL